MPDKLFQDIVSAAGDPMIARVVQDRKRSLTMVFENGNTKLMAGSERPHKKALKKMKATSRKGAQRKKNVKASTTGSPPASKQGAPSKENPPEAE